MYPNQMYSTHPIPYIQSITLTDIHLLYTSHIHTEPPTVMFLGLETPLVDSIPHKPKN